MASRGWFITFEGSEGCGKSTQIRRLSSMIRNSGREVILLREPGGTPIGEKLRHLLQHDESAGAMTPETELLLFAASRAQLVREVVRPALQRGAAVLCDRFLDSTTVYQGVARALDPIKVSLINDFAVCGTLPDLTLLLDLPVEEGSRRSLERGGPADRMEQESLSFFEAVRAGYLELAQKYPGRISLIDAAPDEASVAKFIEQVIKERCHGLI